MVSLGTLHSESARALLGTADLLLSRRSVGPKSSYHGISKRNCTLSHEGWL